MYRQGDVLIIPVSEIETDAIINRDNNRVVLAYGEVTGHAHAFSELHVSLYAPKKPVQKTDRVLRVVGNVAYLRHEEHSPIEIPPGNYIVRRQREWTDADEPRVVAD